MKDKMKNDEWVKKEIERVEDLEKPQDEFYNGYQQGYLIALEVIVGKYE